MIDWWQFWGGLSVVIAFLHSSRLQHPEEWNHRPYTSPFYPYQCPVSNTHYNIYMISRYNRQILFLYVIQILSCRISWLESCLVHLAISAAVETSETFVSLTGPLLLASVAPMTWILQRRFLRDGKSPLTSDILPGTYYQRKSVQIISRKLYAKVGIAHGLW